MKYKITDIKEDELPFGDFLTSRYSMTVKVKADECYTLSKRKNIPFFNLTAACILEAINEIPEFKLRIRDGNVIEYDYINAVSPIMQEDYSIREIEIVPPSEFEDIYKWNDYVENKKNNYNRRQFNH